MKTNKFPQMLVLPMTTLFEDTKSGNKDLEYISQQISQGNTFSVSFDMSEAPQEPNRDGLVYMLPNEQSNFKAVKKIQMSNEGLSNMIGFMSIGESKATIFGKDVTITRIFLTGKPDGDTFVWETGIILNNELSIAYTEHKNEYLRSFLSAIER